MEPKVIKSGTYMPVEKDRSSRLKTTYFRDGSAIIVTEKAIVLVETIAPYEVHPRSENPEQPCDLVPLPNRL